MSKKNKEIFLLFGVIITLSLCILNIAIAINADKLVEMLIVGEMEIETGGIYHAFDWKIIIIIFSLLLLGCSIVSYLFNIEKFKIINRKVQSVLLYIDISLVLLCVFSCLMCLCSIYSSFDLLLTGIKDSNSISSEWAAVKNLARMMNNYCFRDSLIVLVISSVCNMIIPIISLNVKIEDNNEKVTDKNQLSDNDINEDMKKEINKLKQQLELKDLKKQYSDLYKKLHDNEKSDYNSIDETVKY